MGSKAFSLPSSSTPHTSNFSISQFLNFQFSVLFSQAHHQKTIGAFAVQQYCCNSTAPQPAALLIFRQRTAVYQVYKYMMGCACAFAFSHFCEFAYLSPSSESFQVSTHEKHIFSGLVARCSACRITTTQNTGTSTSAPRRYSVCVCMLSAHLFGRHFTSGG